ncbi:MAG: PLP-dependent aminotransferase family protein [Eubacterium sp.]|nr:PLP-dependent aminotransferase family protein [Eubacterium sp.]
MLSYTFTDTKKPLYEQLYEFLRDDILEGKISPDEALPSKRNFAKQLSVSVITVENAYNQLLSEGFIYSLPRKGFYASEIFDDRKGLEVFNYHDTGAGKTLKKEGISKEESYFADFASNSTDPESFPFSIWAKLTRRILSEDQDFLMKNSPSNGLPDLRRAIADYLLAFRGMKVNFDNIIIGAGTETMYNILIQLLGHELTYACEDPGYDKIRKILISNGVKNIRIPLDENGVDISKLERNMVDIIHVTPSHHFPTGITMPIKRRYELLNWANRLTEKTKFIIEDDYDSEFRLSGLPVPPIYSIDTGGSVIYMNTFTKSLASTIRISYMILPDRLMELYKSRLDFYACTVSTFEQLTLARFISEGYYEKHINRMRTAYRKKRDLLLRSIGESPLSEVSEVCEEQSGLHFILKLRIGMDTNTFADKCKRLGVNISPVSDMSFMINYSSVPNERIPEAIKRISTII